MDFCYQNFVILVQLCLDLADKKIVGKKREADQLAEGRAEMQAEEMDDFASGGLAHMLGR